MEKIITKPEGDKGLKVVIQASESYPGEYSAYVYRRGWVGNRNLMSSPDGRDWHGIGFHGTERELKSIATAIVEGTKKEKPALDEIMRENACKLAEKVFDEATKDQG